MSAVGEAVFAVLSTDPTVASLVGVRIYPNVMPEGSALPAIVYQSVSDVPENSLNGKAADRLVASRVQIDCYARPSSAGGAYRQARALAAAVDAALCDAASLSCWLEISRDLFDNETQYHRVSMDFSVWR